LNVTLLDEAGNVTTTKLEQIKCASSLISLRAFWRRTRRR
jgi:hypothetical protein